MLYPTEKTPLHLNFPADQVAATLKDCLSQVRPNLKTKISKPKRDAYGSSYEVTEVDTKVEISEYDANLQSLCIRMNDKEIVATIHIYGMWACCGAVNIVIAESLPQEIVDCFFDCYGTCGKMLIIKSPVLPSKVIRISPSVGVYSATSALCFHKGRQYDDWFQLLTARCAESFPELKLRLSNLKHKGRHITCTNFPTTLNIADNVLFIYHLPHIYQEEARILPKLFNDCTFANQMLGISTSAQSTLSIDQKGAKYTTDVLKENGSWPVVAEVKNPNTSSMLRLHAFTREEAKAPDEPSAKQEVPAALTK